MTVHYVGTLMNGPQKGPERQRWTALCGVNNQRAKPASSDPEDVTCLRCLDALTRPGRCAS